MSAAAPNLNFELQKKTIRKKTMKKTEELGIRSRV